MIQKIKKLVVKTIKLSFLYPLSLAFILVFLKNLAPLFLEKKAEIVVSHKRSEMPGAVDILIPALIEIESDGHDWKVGDQLMGNKAYGCLQIRQPCMDDVNRCWHQHHRAEECRNNRPLSVAVCQEYLSKYGRKERLGREPTMEDLARIWNGGPDGWKNPKTEWYWEKVQEAIERKAKLNQKAPHA